MPPSPKITKEMITSAGFNIVREEGEEALNVRKAAARLNCSTQPVMYHFRTVEEMKMEIYKRADVFHSLYITEAVPDIDDPVLSRAIRYVMFGAKEKNLFKFLFKSDKFESNQFEELSGSEGTSAMYNMLCEREDLSMEQAKDVFIGLLLKAHGFASLLANDSLKYDEEYIVRMLKLDYEGSLVYYGLRRFRKMRQK